MVANCIKCTDQYEEADSEAYYCPTCLVEVKAIAQEIDRKRATRPSRPVKSDLQLYNEAQKVHGFMRVKL